jgi:hypothetical protein
MKNFKSAMKPEVKAKLESILKYPFFSSVGQPLPTTVSRVDTWPRAAKTCGFLKWENNRIMARNTLQGGITDQFPKPGMWERMQEWNPLINELDPIIEPFVGDLLQKIPLNDKDRQKVKDEVVGDIKLIFLETHYQDIVKPVFHVPYLDPWYAAGHFPCGWDGDEFPIRWDGVINGGQLIVF